MFKKTLVAASMLAAFGASAATVTSVDTDDRTKAIGLEGYSVLAANAKKLTSGTELEIEVKSAADYIENDVVVITVAGADSIKESTGGVTVSGTGAGGVDYLDITGNTIRLRVNSTGVTSGQILTVDGVEVLVASPSASSVISVSSTAVSNSNIIGEYDQAKAAAVAFFGKQFALDADSQLNFDGEINVEKGRAEFTGGTVNADALTLATDFVTPAAAAVTPTVITYKVTAEDLSYLMDYDADKDGELSAAELGGAVTVALSGGDAGTKDDVVTLAINEELTEITVTQTIDTIAETGAVITLANKGQAAKGSQLSVQSFSLDVEVTDGTDKFVAADGVDAGEWTLNGAVAHVPFMPYGAGYSQSVTVANTSNQEGGIEVLWYVDGETISTPLTAVAAANSVTNISKELRSLAEANGIEGSVAFDVIVNAPENNIETVALYFNNGDRLRTNSMN